MNKGIMIGGPMDGRMFQSEQWLLTVPTIESIEEGMASKGRPTRFHQYGFVLRFFPLSDDEFISAWVHESMNNDQAIKHLLDRYQELSKRAEKWRI